MATEINEIARSLVKGSTVETYNTLPALEVSRSINFSELLESVQVNSEAAGTILQTEGASVAVIFNIQQYETVKNILNFIPKIIQEFKTDYETRFIPNMTKKLKADAASDCKMELNKVGSELLKISSSLKNPLYMTVAGTICIIFGLYVIRNAQRIRRRVETESLNESQYESPSGRTMYKYPTTAQQKSNKGLMPAIGGITMIVGFGLFIGSALLTYRVSANCLALASKLRG